MNTGNRRFRAYIVLFFFLLFLGAIVAKIAYLQIFSSAFFKRLSVSQHKAVIPIEGERGRIYDRQGRVLATNVNSYSVYADPGIIDDKEVLAGRIAGILGLEKADVEKQLYSDRRFVWIKRKVSLDEAWQIKSLKERGLGILRRKRRFYPHKEVACHVLGGVDIDNKGIEGIELLYDRYLRGKQGFISTFKDSASNILALYPEVINPQEGADLHLTIDAQIQYWVERALKGAVEEFRAGAASAIVMDPESGEILALANWPCFDPNKIGEYSRDDIRDRAVTDIFEPGSVFKIVTLTAALSTGAFDAGAGEKIYCEKGLYKIPGTVLHDWKPYGDLTFIEVFKKSSNIGVAKIAQQVGKERLYSYVKKMGFGEKTRVDLPGETPGILKPVERWSNTSSYIIPIGQEIGVNLVQLGRAISIIANGGCTLRPYLMKKVWRNGMVIAEGKVIKERVLPVAAMERAQDILCRVVEDGTGRRAAIEGVKVGGKTGTAQKFDLETGRYSSSKYRASFIGFLRKGDISLAMAISVDEPSSKSHFGGVVAAPLLREIGKRSLSYLEYKGIVGNDSGKNQDVIF